MSCSRPGKWVDRALQAAVAGRSKRKKHETGIRAKINGCSIKQKWLF